MTITSHHNRKLKEIRKLRQRRRWRERSGRFVAEGEDLLAAADAAGWEAVERYCAAGSGLSGVEVDAALLASASGLASGTRTLAVYEERWAPAPLGPLCVYLHGLQDPGNVGTILRGAAAFGASSVALGPGTADPFGLKAVRASMGAVFAVPMAKVGEVGGPPGVKVGELPGVKVALVPGQGVPLHELCSLTSSIAKLGGKAPGEGSRQGGAEAAAGVSLLIGAEREGLPEDVIRAADIRTHIPIATSSLNAAMAATIALYELGTRMPHDERGARQHERGDRKMSPRTDTATE
jgi:TrmH family RNA methyltransferase